MRAPASPTTLGMELFGVETVGSPATMAPGRTMPGQDESVGRVIQPRHVSIGDAADPYDITFDIKFTTSWTMRSPSGPELARITLIRLMPGSEAISSVCYPLFSPLRTLIFEPIIDLMISMSSLSNVLSRYRAVK